MTHVPKRPAQRPASETVSKARLPPGCPEQEERKNEEEREDERNHQSGDGECQRTEGGLPGAVRALEGPAGCRWRGRRGHRNLNRRARSKCRRSSSGRHDDERGRRTNREYFLGGHQPRSTDIPRNSGVFHTCRRRRSNRQTCATASAELPPPHRYFNRITSRARRLVSNGLVAAVPERKQIVEKAGQHQRRVEREPNKPTEKSPLESDHITCPGVAHCDVRRPISDGLSGVRAVQDRSRGRQLPRLQSGSQRARDLECCAASRTCR